MEGEGDCQRELVPGGAAFAAAVESYGGVRGEKMAARAARRREALGGSRAGSEREGRGALFISDTASQARRATNPRVVARLGCGASGLRARMLGGPGGNPRPGGLGRWTRCAAR